MSTISVIVPVYNTEKYLHRCIDSILAQTFTDFELILVDDGSTDSSGAICDEYAAKDSRIRVFHQSNQGQAAARNHALDWMFANSDSKYISFVDSDDSVHTGYLSSMLDAIACSGCSVSICGYKKVTSENECVSGGTGGVTVLDFEEYFCTVIPGYDSVSPVARLYSRELLGHVRFPEGKICEDLFVIPKVLFECSKIAVIDAFFYYYFQTEDSTMRQKWNRRLLDEVEASEELLRFMSEKQNDNLKKRAVKRYMWVLCKQENAISAMPDRDRWAYKLVLRKMRKLLLSNRDVFPPSDFSWYYETAFPKLNWLYWSVVGIKNRIKRMVNRNADN